MAHHPLPRDGRAVPAGDGGEAGRRPGVTIRDARVFASRRGRRRSDRPPPRPPPRRPRRPQGGGGRGGGEGGGGGGAGGGRGRAPAPVRLLRHQQDGVARAPSWTTSDANMARSIDDMKAMGAVWLRFPMFWADIQSGGRTATAGRGTTRSSRPPGPGASSSSARCPSRRPGPARRARATARRPPTSATTRTSRRPSRATTGPSASTPGRSGTSPTSALLAAEARRRGLHHLLKAAYTAITQADPSAVVVTGGSPRPPPTAPTTPRSLPQGDLRQRRQGLLRRRGPPPVQLPGRRRAQGARRGAPGTRCSARPRACAAS